MTLTRSLRSNSALFVVLSARAVTLLSISQQFSLIAALESILSLTELILSPRSCSFWPIELIMLWSLVFRASPFSSKVLIYMQDILKKNTISYNLFPATSNLWINYVILLNTIALYTQRLFNLLKFDNILLDILSFNIVFLF